MNLYDEFFSIVAMFNKLGIRYAVVGGIALAFHGKPRFTRDVDFLVHQRDGDVMKMALEGLDYQETAEPWMLPDTSLILRRFLKVQGQDEIMVDVLLASDDAHWRIIEDAVSAESEVGPVPVAARRDIIWMKRQRNSDIEKAVRLVSDLYEFYRKIPKLSSQCSEKDDEHGQRAADKLPKSTRRAWLESTSSGHLRPSAHDDMGLLLNIKGPILVENLQEEMEMCREGKVSSGSPRFS